MKKLISTLSLIFFVGVVSVSAQCCSGATASNSTSSKTDCSETHKTKQVKPYYFHSTRRCETCKAAESVTEETLKEYYGDKVAFESINVDKDKENAMVKKYKISGSALLIVNGDKKVDMTGDAFMNARTNPDKLKSKLKSTIDSMI